MASREIFWNIPYSFVIYVLAAISVTFWILVSTGATSYGIWASRMTAPSTSAKEYGFSSAPPSVDVLAHRRFLRDPYPGMMHLIIFWGFIILLLASGVDAVTHYIIGHIIGTPYLWFKLVVNIGGLLALIGIIMAAYRRYVLKPEEAEYPARRRHWYGVDRCDADYRFHG